MYDLCDFRPIFSSDESTSIEGSCSLAMSSPIHRESDRVEERTISLTLVQVSVLEVTLALPTTFCQNVIRLSKVLVIQRKIRKIRSKPQKIHGLLFVTQKRKIFNVHTLRVF